MRKLLLLTLVVALAHGFLLWVLPDRTALFSGRQDGLMTQAQASSFVTRTIEPTALPATRMQTLEPVVTKPPIRVAAPAPASAAKNVSIHVPAPVKKLLVPPPTPGPTPVPAPLAPATLVAPEPLPVVAVAAPLQIAAATPVDGSAKTKPEPAMETKSTATATAAVASTASRLPKPVYPPATRLLYEGKGEEKGFLKYTAGGELVWAPDGTQYNAKLEITFLLARLRTWTSKGELSEYGLQPTRFGDKPRGAELATHFQRDKGIISFSANNPDVPLQPGAQDKLSALLQLSAIVAGAPARYGAGSSISFQAADAHRAEMWDFKVSGSESLELPGGTLSGIKLTKEPTVEFDQRIEVWLAPDIHYLPVRLRITESNGTFVDLLWRKTQKPE
jgi:hypothetical protein